MKILILLSLSALVSPHSTPFHGRRVPPRGTVHGMYKFGMSPEDPRLNVRSVPLDSPLALPDTTPMEIASNTVEELIEVVEMESPSDPLMGDLKQVMQDMTDVQQNQEPKVTTRTQTNDDEAIAQSFEDRVKVLLAASGIETVLPLDCGRNPRSSENPLEDLPLPWVAALGSSEDGRFHYRCTGVVISHNHILTDGDCAASPNINLVQLNVTEEVPNPNAIQNYVVGRRVHPMVKGPKDLLSGYNVGLLELAFPLEFNEYVQPVCIPGLFEKPNLEKQEDSYVVGFNNIQDTSGGRTATLYAKGNSSTSGASFCQSLIKFYNSRFPDRISNLNSVLTKNHMCLDVIYDEIGKSVVLRQNEDTSRVQVIGVSGVANARLPAPVAYTLVQPQRLWVELVLKKYNDNIARRTIL